MSVSRIDWDAIEREYRAGQLSIREIGRQFGVSEGGIRKRAKSRGWQRDLSRQVKERVRTAMVQGTQPDAGAHPTTPEEEEEIVQAAAKRTLAVVESHRKDARQQKEIVRTLQGLITERISRTDEMGVQDLKAVSIIQRNSAQALDKLVGIERKAFSMDESSGDEDAPDAITITFHRK